MYATLPLKWFVRGSFKSVRCAGHPKVDEFCLACRAHHDVSGIGIPMHDVHGFTEIIAATVRVLERIEYINKYSKGDFGGNDFTAVCLKIDHIAQVEAGYKFQGEVVFVFDFTEVVHLRDVRVSQS